MSIDLLNDDSGNSKDKVLSLKCPTCGGIYRKLTTCGIVIEHIECCPFGKRMKEEALRYAESFKKGGGEKSVPPSAHQADRTSAEKPLPPLGSLKVKCEGCKQIFDEKDLNEFGFCSECGKCEYCGGLRRVLYGDREIACSFCRQEPDYNDIGD